LDSYIKPISVIMIHESCLVFCISSSCNIYEL